MGLETKQSSPTVSDSALRMNSDFPELPESVTKRFPEMTSWAREVDKFWRQNVNAVGDFARAVLDVTEIAGVLVVDSGDGSLSIHRGTRGKSMWGDADTPFYVNRDGFFSLGSRLGWDPRDNTLTIEGTIVADAGVIGGWTISTTALTSGSGANTVGLDSGGVNPAIYAGSATPGSAPFRVTQAGALFASNATISGSITATTGSIGGWTIGATTLSGTNAVLSSAGTLLLGTGNDVAIVSANDATYRLWVGNATAGLASFSVTKGGALFATGATISGTLSASSGTIGGFTLTPSSLTAGSGTTLITLNTSGSTGLLLGDASGTTEHTELFAGGLIMADGATPKAHFNMGGTGGVRWGRILLLEATGTINTVIMNGNTGLISASGTITGNLFSGSGASLTTLNASNLASGTVPTARLGSGSATSTTVLHGNSTWSAVSASDVSGLAASATTDTTNASNISSGTLSNSRLPSAISVSSLATANFEASVGTAVDVKDVNFRVYQGGTQNARIDYTTGFYYVQGNQVVGARGTRGAAGLTEVVALLDAWGAWA